MSKKKKPKDPVKLKKRPEEELKRLAKDKSRPKKVRKAARAELDAIRGVFVPSVATGDDTAAPSSPSSAPAAPATSPEGSESVVEAEGPLRAAQDAEVARQWAHFRGEEVVKDVEAADLSGPEVAERHEVVLEGPTAVPAEPWLDQPVDDLGHVAQPLQEAREVQTDHGREFAVGPAQPEARDLLEKPEDPVLANGNGQPLIHYRDPRTGAEKVKGYTRVTTYIDCLDDKTVLNKWKFRTLLEGAAVEAAQLGDGMDSSIDAVARSVRRTDEALADIDRRTKEEGELLELRRQEVQKEHRDTLERIAEDLLDLGGAHEAANKGTDLHRLVELVNQGQPLPDSTTPSDRRDIEAYQRALKALNAEVLWTERRVVLDDIQVSGTMDVAYLVKLPGMTRRTRVVADVKTGRVDFAPGKIGMQLALYARGFGYDWTRPLERERLSLSQHHGLLIHLPQGEGRCSIYLVDLELAAKGLDLARQVREWRNTAKRLYDLKDPVQAVEV
jgi:hypothetical protein